MILDRTFRITKKKPQIGDIITFEAPSEDYSKWSADQTNPVAKYNNEPEGLFNKFVLKSNLVLYFICNICIKNEKNK